MQIATRSPRHPSSLFWTDLQLINVWKWEVLVLYSQRTEFLILKCFSPAVCVCFRTLIQLDQPLLKWQIKVNLLVLKDSKFDIGKNGKCKSTF